MTKRRNNNKTTAVVVRVKQPKQQQRRRNQASQPRSSSNRQSYMPVAVGFNYQTSRPKFLGTGENQLVEYEETIAQLYSPANTPNTFQVGYILRINPGLAGVFPWLSGVASQFESYVFDYLHFEFVSASGTGTDGAIFMSVDFDSADAAPTTLIQMMSMEHAIRGNPYKSFTYVAPGKAIHKRKTYFTRSSVTLPDLGELNLSDTGVLYIASAGIATASKYLGELKVKYRVRLMTPQISQVLAAAQYQSRPAAPTNWVEIAQKPVTSTITTKTKSSMWDDLVTMTELGAGAIKLLFKRSGNYAIQLDAGSNNGTATTGPYTISGTSDGVNATVVNAFPYPAITTTNASSIWNISVTDATNAFITFVDTIAGGTNVVDGVWNMAISFARNGLASLFAVPEPPLEGQFVDHKALIAKWATEIELERRLIHQPDDETQPSGSRAQSDSLLRGLDPRSFPNFQDQQRVYSKNPSPQIR